MRNLKITVEYDGACYHGWQRQKGHATIQQLLEDGIAQITRKKATVIGSGRTDSGVHALNQVAHFKTNSSIDMRSLLLGINSLLPFDVVVKDLREVEAGFHARYDVRSKVYIYQIFNGPVRSALYRNYAWHVLSPLDLAKMEEGLSFLKGVHDFSSFCGKRKGYADCVRRIMDARIESAAGNLIKIFIEADGFLRYMVRAIVGTLIWVGTGKIKPSEIIDILEARDRKRSGITAPPHGLFLAEVRYR
jgi:tRNA pseudouridine38-40 synthase